jgi:hypothetical protein
LTDWGRCISTAAVSIDTNRANGQVSVASTQRLTAVLNCEVIPCPDKIISGTHIAMGLHWHMAALMLKPDRTAKSIFKCLKVVGNEN